MTIATAIENNSFKDRYNIQENNQDFLSDEGDYDSEEEISDETGSSASPTPRTPELKKRSQKVYPRRGSDDSRV